MAPPVLTLSITRELSLDCGHIFGHFCLEQVHLRLQLGLSGRLL